MSESIVLNKSDSLRVEIIRVLKDNVDGLSFYGLQKKLELSMSKSLDTRTLWSGINFWKLVGFVSYSVKRRGSVSVQFITLTRGSVDPLLIFENLLKERNYE